MSEFVVVPEWFGDLLIEWAKDYSGRVVDLRAVSGTQLVWRRKEGERFLSTPDDRERVNAAYAALAENVPSLGQLLRFYYLSGVRATLRDIEREFGIGSRASVDSLRAAQAALFGYYMSLRAGRNPQSEKKVEKKVAFLSVRH